MAKTPTKYHKAVKSKVRDIAKTIQSRREELKLTQEQLAEKLEVSTVTLQFIEQGRRIPSLPMLISICQVLGIPLKIG